SRASFTSDGELAGGDVVGGANGLDQVGAGHGQHMGRHVIAGRRDGGRGDVGNRDAVAGEIGVRGGGRTPIGRCRQIECRRVYRAGAVLVQDAVDGQLVCCVERDRESRGAAGGDVGAGQRVTATL